MEKFKNAVDSGSRKLQVNLGSTTNPELVYCGGLDCEPFTVQKSWKKLMIRTQSTTLLREIVDLCSFEVSAGGRVGNLSNVVLDGWELAETVGGMFFGGIGFLAACFFKG